MHNTHSDPTTSSSACFAKHVNKKAAKWAASKRPRKSRPSDINRKPVVYELDSIVKPPEYTVLDAPAQPVTKPPPAAAPAAAAEP